MLETIEKTIHKDFHLTRQGRDWLLDDDVKLRAPDRHSFGFSLDKKRSFAFFSNSPPEHLAKMCDAIIALLFKQRLFLFIVEQKSAYRVPYDKQLANGKHFCDWLFSLYKEHGYCYKDPVSIGLLIWQPRQLPRKGMTSHQPKGPTRSHRLFDAFFEEQNTTRVYLGDLIRAIS